jgi:hypothetical protein
MFSVAIVELVAHRAMTPAEQGHDGQLFDLFPLRQPPGHGRLTAQYFSLLLTAERHGDYMSPFTTR